MITTDVYRGLSYEEQLEYVTAVLGGKSEKVGGKVRAMGEPRNGELALFVIPYNSQGEPVRLFSDRPDGIPAYVDAERNTIDKNDYVRGVLGNGGKYRGLRILNIQKMESFEELKKELFDALEERWREEWQREGFVFDEEKIEIAEFDGKMRFGEWLSEEAAYKLQLGYENFIREKMDAQQQKLDALQTEEARMKKAMEPLKSQLEEIRRYQSLGILKEEPNQPDEAECYDYRGYGQLIDEAWGYLWEQKHLYYEKSTVRCFMNALRTQQLIILWGRPGTGKTSLPRGIAEALGAECVRVQVQSNWTDNQDLLGFYNIVEKRYVPTQFLEALVRARNNPNRLYLILLDEMNLSNVEYYFSEMLNVFTWDEAYTLHLYPKKNLEDLKREREKAQEKDISLLDFKLQEMMNDYTPDFAIPPNVRFVGTLNADATTKPISPKVIDRSCLIELQARAWENPEEPLPDRTPLYKKKVSAECFAVQSLTPPRENPIKPRLAQIREIFKVADLSVSNRIDAYADQWFGREEDCVQPDEIVLEKILPLIDLEYTKEDKENKKMIERLKSEVLEQEPRCEKSLEKLERMEAQATKTDRIQYWEN